MRDIKGKTKRVSIGRFPSPYGVERAREEAEEILRAWKKGKDQPPSGVPETPKQ